MKTYIGIICGIVVLLVGIVYLHGRQQDSEVSVACTMEALICPDGSAVGRSGSDCAFSACPQQDYFYGIITRNSTGFSLLVGSDEMEYMMPLVTQNNMVRDEFIGQYVTISGTFREGNVLQVNAINLSEPNEEQEISVSVGEARTVQDMTIRLDTIIEDSRCPVDVVCIQEGRVVAGVTIFVNGEERYVEISSLVPFAFDTYRISITDIYPRVTSETEIKEGLYEITFQIDTEA